MIANQISQGRRREARLIFWVVGGLLLVFGALAAYHFFFSTRSRFEGDQALLDELANASSAPASSSDAGKKVPAPSSEKVSLPWPQWRGPNRDGFLSFPNLLTSWPSEGPPVVWDAPGGGGYSSFAIGAGRAFTLLTVDGEQEAVVCWDARKGKELWRHTYEPSRQVEYAGPRSTPTLDRTGERLYVVGSAGLLLCLDTRNGKVKWEVDLVAALDAPNLRWGFTCSPLVDGKNVIVITGAPGKCVAAFDRLTGKPSWAAHDGPAGYSSPIVTSAGGTRQIVCFLGNRLVGATPDEGKLLWEFPWPTRFEVNAATPLAFQFGSADKVLDYVFITSGYEKGSALVKIEKAGGQFHARLVYETNALCGHFASPVRRDDHVYGLDEKRELTCLDVRTGTVTWRRRGFGKGSLLRINDYLLILGDSGKLALAEANPAEYSEVALAKPLNSKPCWATPAFADGLLYLRDESRVVCLDLRQR